MAVLARKLTLEEFLRLPEEKPALEYVDGVVTQKVSPKGRHSRLQIVLARLLEESAQQGRIAWALPELRTIFAGNTVVPDVSVYLRERMPVDATGEIADVFHEPPDIAVEIVSPEQSVNGLVRRCLWYVDNGVRVALLVDPADRSVLAFRPDKPAVSLRGQDRIDLHEVMLDFEPTVDQLFASLRRE